jgi:FkbM family methyltransferase
MTRLASLLRAGLRARVRGSTRAAFTLSRWIPSLRAVPVVVNNSQTMFVDLRNGLAHTLLEGSPWQTVPWETDEQAIMRSVVSPGDVVFDIGANIGLHTALLAERVGPSGHVEAFEPNHELLYAIRQTALHAGNITVHAFGLGDQVQRHTFYIPEDQSMASLADWTEGRVGKVRTVTCELKTVDGLVEAGVLRFPRFVKCDVEGAETQVFRGARRTLNHETAPIVLYEANSLSTRAFGLPIESATTFLRELDAARFEIFHVQPNGTLRPLPSFRVDCNHYNLLAIPAARLSEIRELL